MPTKPEPTFWRFNLPSQISPPCLPGIADCKSAFPCSHLLYGVLPTKPVTSYQSLMGCRLHSLKLATKWGEPIMRIFELWDAALLSQSGSPLGSLATSQIFLLILASFLHSTSHSAHTIVYNDPSPSVEIFLQVLSTSFIPRLTSCLHYKATSLWH